MKLIEQNDLKSYQLKRKSIFDFIKKENEVIKIR